MLSWTRSTASGSNVISLRPFFTGGIETEEQLEAALDGIREECSRLIGEGKKIVVEVAPMDRSTRNSIERATQRARRLLEDEFAAQLEGTFDILRGGHISSAGAPARPRQMWPATHDRRRDRAQTAAGMTPSRRWRTTCATPPSRLSTGSWRSRCWKLVSCVQECISRGELSSGYTRVHGHGARGRTSAERQGYRLYVESLSTSSPRR